MNYEMALHDLINLKISSCENFSFFFFFTNIGINSVNNPKLFHYHDPEVTSKTTNFVARGSEQSLYIIESAK